MKICFVCMFVFMHVCERMGMIVWVCVCVCECVCGHVPHGGAVGKAAPSRWTACLIRTSLRVERWYDRPDGAKVPHLVFLLSPFQVELEFKLLDGKSRGKLPHCILSPKAKMPQLTWLLVNCLLLWRYLLLPSKIAGIWRQDVVFVLKNPFLWTLVATPGPWMCKCSPSWLE